MDMVVIAYKSDLTEISSHSIRLNISYISKFLDISDGY